jgi:predicted nucleic acid-binding protein
VGPKGGEGKAEGQAAGAGVTIIDTSAWIEFIRVGDLRVADLVAGNQALVHPFVYAEIACGPIDDREVILAHLRSLPAAKMATLEEILVLLERRRLNALGLSFVDVSLLAAALVNAYALVTYDKALDRAAKRLRILGW